MATINYSLKEASCEFDSFLLRRDNSIQQIILTNAAGDAFPFDGTSNLPVNPIQK